VRRQIAVLLTLAISTAAAQSPPAEPGITAAPVIAHAYDLILDANFDALNSVLPSTCPPAPAVACRGLEALSLWWQIQLDLRNRSLDATFVAAADRAINDALRMTQAEPQRAEAWFYLGAAYGVRSQYRVYRQERLAAARDGKRIKESLERAIALDPAMHDAEFGIGMYRYYAGIAPAALRFLRFFLLLPGGNREEGLQQLERAAARGLLVKGEAQYQIQILYLWYEHKPAEALALIRQLQQRYPHNPLFRWIEADVLDVYFHDHTASLNASQELLSLALDGKVFRADLAERAARRNIATQIAAMKR
jgi:hypothetical protein